MNRFILQTRTSPRFNSGVFCLNLHFYRLHLHNRDFASRKRTVRIDKGIADAPCYGLSMPQTGYYRIYSRVWYNSGDLQLNESFYMDWRTNTGVVVTQ